MTTPIKGCSIFIECKVWRHESESVKTIYLDGTEFFISSRALMIAQISAVNVDAESGQGRLNSTMGPGQGSTQV